MTDWNGQWARMQLGLVDHPKVVLLTSAHAFGLHVGGILWCAKQLTDGFIPAPQVVRLLPPAIPQGPIKAAVRELHKVGLWEPAPGGHQVHDYLDYQPSKKEVLALAEKRRRAGRKGGQVRGGGAAAQANA